MFETLKAIKKNFPNVEVVAGNVSDGASALELAQAGANGVKVGQGPGSICSTRIETGIGMPQVTAIYNCVMALKASGFSHIPLSADGGLRNHGDFPVAIAAGAHTTMVGKMLAGTKEAPTPIIVRKDGSRVKLYRGMGSISALNDNESSRERYAANKGSQILAEGVESYVPYSGDLKDVLGLCILGLKKGMRYAKNQTIEEHREKATFIRITGSGLRESHPHDVELI
jgi:IMP dehydrogenase